MSTPGQDSIFSSNQFDSQQDRRQHPRVHVHWHCFVDMPHSPQRSRVVEISEVGFGFISDVAYPLGSTVKFRLSIPDPSNGSVWHDAPGDAEIMSSVLSREGFRSGVVIKSMSATHQDMIKTWVKMRLR